MKRITKALCMVAVGCSLAFAQTEWTTSRTGTHNGYDYELWSENNAGTSKMTLTGDNGSGANAKGGTFTAQWSNTLNVLFRSGKKYSGTQGTSGQTHKQIGNMSIDFDATWSSPDNVKMLGVYGWAFYAQGSIPTRDENNTSRSFSNQIEYYIIQDRGSYNAATGGDTRSTVKGEATIDGILYEFRVCDRIGRHSLQGSNTNFKQYFSVPKSTGSHRTKGVISVSKHFEEWEKAGMLMDGPFYEVALKVESYSTSGASGSATVTKNLLTVGGTVNPNNFALTTNVTPSGAGTVTRNPNAASYAPGTNVQLTAAAEPGWTFTGWSGGATGTGTTVSVNMNAEKTVTATFTPAEGNTTNLIKDGNFPGTSLTTNWELHTGEYYGNSSATASVSGGRATINISSIGANAWEPQLVQPGIALDQGMNYTLTFSASATAARSIEILLQESGGEYTTYTSGKFDLGTTLQSFSLPFTMTAASDPAAQLAFNLGGSTENVTISNVSLTYGITSGICLKNPTASAAKNSAMRVLARSGSGINLKFRAAGSGDAVVKLYSLRGDVISSARMRTVAGRDYSHTFGSAKLPSGFYLVELRSGGRVEQARVVAPK
ncbi:MAG: glycoside hydrolase family 11 protein [Chitinispirillia bacterium]|nr:glycoside hydrolase family 11 protein [Chitinispirillia bacterium]MCL2267728.1 glycoside hydrolase family 11 protein [Chitinispirillia bacterium]